MSRAEPRAYLTWNSFVFLAGGHTPASYKPPSTATGRARFYERVACTSLADITRAKRRDADDVAEADEVVEIYETEEVRLRWEEIDKAALVKYWLQGA